MFRPQQQQQYNAFLGKVHSTKRKVNSCQCKTQVGSVCQVAYSLTALMKGLFNGQHQQSQQQVSVQRLLELYGLPAPSLKQGAAYKSCM